MIIIIEWMILISLLHVQVLNRKHEIFKAINKQEHEKERRRE
jgi:hypothetical protein